MCLVRNPVCVVVDCYLSFGCTPLPITASWLFEYAARAGVEPIAAAGISGIMRQTAGGFLGPITSDATRSSQHVPSEVLDELLQTLRESCAAENCHWLRDYKTCWQQIQKSAFPIVAPEVNVYVSLNVRSHWQMSAKDCAKLTCYALLLQVLPALRRAELKNVAGTQAPAANTIINHHLHMEPSVINPIMGSVTSASAVTRHIHLTHSASDLPPLEYAIASACFPLGRGSWRLASPLPLSEYLTFRCKAWLSAFTLSPHWLIVMYQLLLRTIIAKPQTTIGLRVQNNSSLDAAACKALKRRCDGMVPGALLLLFEQYIVFFQKGIVDVRSLQTAALLPWQPEVF